MLVYHWVTMHACVCLLFFLYFFFFLNLVLMCFHRIQNRFCFSAFIVPNEFQRLHHSSTEDGALNLCCIDYRILVPWGHLPFLTILGKFRWIPIFLTLKIFNISLVEWKHLVVWVQFYVDCLDRKKSVLFWGYWEILGLVISSMPEDFVWLV